MLSNFYMMKCFLVQFVFLAALSPNWIHFSISVQCNILHISIFKAPSSTPEGDRHVCLLTFVYGIQCSTTFIVSVFSYNSYFWQRRAPNWFYFSISVQCNILNKHLGFYTPWVPGWFWKYCYYIDNIDNIDVGDKNIDIINIEFLVKITPSRNCVNFHGHYIQENNWKVSHTYCNNTNNQFIMVT